MQRDDTWSSDRYTVQPEAATQPPRPKGTTVKVRDLVVILATHCSDCGEDGDLLPNGKHPECSL